jgi:hypothetical protein
MTLINLGLAAKNNEQAVSYVAHLFCSKKMSGRLLSVSGWEPA